MKRIVSILVSICILITIFCGFTKTEQPNAFAEKFVRTYFTLQDFNKIKISDKDFWRLYTNNYSRIIHNMMSEAVYKNDCNNREYLSVLDAAVSCKHNLKVQSYKTIKSSKNKDGSYYYDFTITINKLYKDKSIVKSTIGGQVSIKKINKEWKVVRYWFDKGYIAADLRNRISTNKSSAQTPVKKVEVADHEKGYLWEVKSNTATVYLFGSIHVAKDSLFPLGKKAEAAFNKASKAVFEIDLSQPQGIPQTCYYQGNDDVYNHLSKESKEILDDYALKNGIVMNDYKQLKIYLLDSLITNRYYLGLGYSSGVDMYFTKKAMNNKTILELEGADFQYKILDGMSEELQQKILINDITNIASNQNEFQNKFEKMYDAYVRGDEVVMNESVNAIKAVSEEYYKTLIVDRNIGMADKIEGYLKTKDTYFIVAGAGHFIGSDSVVKLLESKGYVVERLK